MYAWIFRHLPGPTWFKVIESLALIGAAVAALFTWVYPWVQSYLELGQSSVGGAGAARFWKGRGRGHPGLVPYPRVWGGVANLACGNFCSAVPRARGRSPISHS